MGAGLDKLSNVNTTNQLQDLSGFALKEAIQTKNSRFLKTLECVCEEGRVLVKVYARRGESLETLQREKGRLESINGTFLFLRHSNVLPFARVVVTERAAFLVRQYLAHNLAERLGTRPFLSALEKRWILYQLLKALDQCHQWGISHGDVTTENVLLTSWQWAYLTDFSPFKPAFLPLEDPSDFTFFYNSSGRTAYIAPERFYSTASETQPEYLSCSELPPAADVFSFGCVAAELFLPSERPLFDFSQLLAFRKGEYNVEDVIATIEDPWIRELVRRSTLLDPSKRISISQALIEWPDKSFAHLHAYYSARLGGADPDMRVQRMTKDFDQLVSIVEHPELPFPDAWPSALPKAPPKGLELRHTMKTVAELDGEAVDASPSPDTAIGVLSEAHSLVEPVSVAAVGRATALEASVVAPRSESPVPPSSAAAIESRSSSPQTAATQFLPGSEDSFDGRDDVLASSTPAPARAACEAMVVMLSMVSSCVRNVRTPSVKMEALKLLVRFASLLDDECRLQRIVPFIFAVLPHSDDKPLVRACVIRALEQVLSQVTTGEPAVFQAYIVPGIAHFSRDPDETVREVLASCLASLTTSARRLSETVLAPDQGFDGVLHELRRSFHTMVRDLLEDNSMAVKRRILMSLTPLCLFFGRRVSTETFVPFVLTFLSHTQWQLRVAAYHHLLGVMSIVGAKSLEDITVALISKSFADPEESVIDRAVLCVVSLVQAGLLRKKVVFDLSTLAAPLLIHPSKWIRKAALALQEAVWDSLTLADRHVFFCPAISPFLSAAIIPSLPSSAIGPLVKAPVSRQDMIVALAVAHELYRKGHKVDGQGFSVQLLSRLKQNKVEDAALGRVLLMAAWMQCHAEGNMAKMQEAEAAASSDSGSAGGANGGGGGGEREGTIEKPIVLANVNVVAIEKRVGSEEAAAATRYTDDEWNRKFAHISLKQLAPGSAVPGISLSTALDPNATVTPGGPGFGPGVDANGSGALATVMQEETPAVTLNLSIGENADDLAGIGGSGSGSGNSGDGGNNNNLVASGGSLNAAGMASAMAGRHNAWRPKGTLVAHLHEHTAAVSQISVSDDQRFFVSGSLDGSVKVWDCERLHTIVTNRSRLTCKLQKGHINSVTTIKNTHSVASACNLGTVHIFNIEHQRRVEKSFTKTVYTGIQTVRFIDKSEGSIFDVRSFEGTPSSSVLMYATAHGNLHGWDLRMKTTSQESFVMRNSPRMGLLTSVAVDNTHNWVIVGSDLGVYTIWDLRFQIPVRSFSHPGESGVVALAAAPRHAAFSSTADNTVTLWDVESNIARHVLRIVKARDGSEASSSSNAPLPNVPGYLRPRAVASEGPLASLPPVSMAAIDGSGMISAAASISGSVFARPRSTTVDAMLKESESMSDLTAIAAAFPSERNAVRAMLPAGDGSWLVTGSTDCKLRFWDLARPTESYTFSGLPKHHKAVYSSSAQEGISVVQEQVEVTPNPAVRSANAGLATASTAHRDAITYLAMLHSGSHMLVSSDRAGVIKVFL